jgi:hypothetical protein
MTVYDLFPGYVLLDYHSTFGAHKAILPTRAWNAASVTGVLGSYENWASNPVDAEAMIDDLVTALLPFHHTSTEFDAATIYTIAAVGDPAIPRAGKALTAVGSSSSALQRKAVTQTWVFRDTGWNISKLVLMDTPIGINFDKVTDITGSADALALASEWTSDVNAWSSRANLQPDQFRNIVYDLNDKLRKEYGMT